MSKWHVVGSVTGSKYLGVFEAETKEAAEKMALESAFVSLCRQCEAECEDGSIEEASAELIEGGTHE